LRRLSYEPAVDLTPSACFGPCLFPSLRRPTVGPRPPPPRRDFFRDAPLVVCPKLDSSYRSIFFSFLPHAPAWRCLLTQIISSDGFLHTGASFSFLTQLGDDTERRVTRRPGAPLSSWCHYLFFPASPLFEQWAELDPIAALRFNMLIQRILLHVFSFGKLSSLYSPFPFFF